MSSPIKCRSPADETRSRLVRAALVLFGEKGFDATSTREIADAANANIGSIAYHFGGKDGLRQACAAYIVKMVGEAAGGVLPSDAAALPSTSEAAEALLGHTIQTMVGFLVSRPEAGEAVQFILREMSRPTAALDTIYDGVFEPVHKKLCSIWEVATGEPADSPAAKLAVFTVIGQAVYFRVGREAVKRRMGWSEIGEREAATIARTVQANLSAIIADRRKQR